MLTLLPDAQYLNFFLLRLMNILDSISLWVMGSRTHLWVITRAEITTEEEDKNIRIRDAIISVNQLESVDFVMICMHDLHGLDGWSGAVHGHSRPTSGPTSGNRKHIPSLDGF
jgi:hypothetical protein